MKSEIQIEAEFYLHRYFFINGNEILLVVAFSKNHPIKDVGGSKDYVYVLFVKFRVG